MKSVLTISIALLVLAVLPASARPPTGEFEQGRELEASMVTLPAAVGGTIGVQGCTACKQTDYTMAHDVRFYLAQREVSFGEFKRYLDAHPQAAVFLVNTPKVNVVTRLMAQ